MAFFLGVVAVLFDLDGAALAKLSDLGVAQCQQVSQ
jgi:hypothetical protein